MTDLNQLSDQELVKQAQAGKVEAFTSLYDRYLPVVYNRVRYKIPETDVEDVTQEVFITLMKSLPNFEFRSQFKTWLRTLVNRRIVDYYRRRKPVNSESDLQTGEDQGSCLEQMEIAMDTKNWDDIIALRRALKKLPEHYQEIILLRFVDGLQFSEIASLNGQTLEATKSLFRRSISALRTTMDEAYD